MKLSEHKNPGKQGDAGLGVAIGWFASNGWTVCVPLTDSQEYDLIVDNGSGLKKIQVKTSRYICSKARAPKVELRTKCGAWKTVKFFTENVDYLFIVTDRGNYLIPRDKITARTGIVLTKKYAEYQAGS